MNIRSTIKLASLLNKLISLLYGLRLYKFSKSPLIKEPINGEYYKIIFENIKKEDKNDLNDTYKKNLKYKIDNNWMHELAYITQVTKKKSSINYNHGKYLYSIFAEYINLNPKISRFNVVETGTARGFSSLCMAKALYDYQKNGLIITIDLLPHLKKIYWNCISDIDGKKTRSELLENWRELSNKYILFLQGETSIELSKLQLERVHFAFLDGEHTYKKLLIELKYINQRQQNNDIILVDDYNKNDFDGVVKATNEFSKSHNYKLELIELDQSRNLAILKKS